MAIRNGASGVGQRMKVKDDLIAGLSLVDIVDGQVEIVGGDGALGTLVHQYQNKMEF